MVLKNYALFMSVSQEFGLRQQSRNVTRSTVSYQKYVTDHYLWLNRAMAKSGNSDLTTYPYIIQIRLDH